jgi:hypothetical protein
MKALFTLLLITCQLGVVLAQTLPILTDQLVLPSKQQVNRDYVEYRVGNIRYYNGDMKNRETFYILDRKTGAKIFEYDESEPKARHLIPKFFMAEGNDDLIIICISLEGDYSWGTYIYIVDHGKVSYPGFLPWGVDNFNFAMLALYSQFEQHGDSFIMFFQEDARLINYVTDELIMGSEVEFKIEKDRITRVK